MRKTIRRSIWLIIALLLIFAASAAAQTVRNDMLVSTDWLQRNRLSVRLIEIGDRATYEKAHIDGAVLVEDHLLLTQVGDVPNELPPLEVLEPVFMNAGVGPRERIVLYSRDPILAARAWFTLDYLGCGDRTSILDGGFTKWLAEGRTTSTEIEQPKPAMFQGRVHPETLARINAVQNLVRWRETLGPGFALIDARSPAQFYGEEAGADIRCPGHIPGAVNIPWSSNFTGGDAPVFLGVDQLRSIYARAGVRPTTANIIYCRTGMQASVDYFVLKYLGYDAILYDGSFIEWSNTGEQID
jgi:thiosulfate/3-mercaptopyruvate sulfurtransferase